MGTCRGGTYKIMLIEFSQICDKLKYKPAMVDVRNGHNHVISYFLNNGKKLSMDDKRRITNMLNKIVYAKLSHDYIDDRSSDESLVNFLSTYDPGVDIDAHLQSVSSPLFLRDRKSVV